jgi:pilus assembly protein Flp/PilA
MLNVIRQFVKDEEGASAAEYALLVALISIAMLAAVNLLGANISAAISTAAVNLAS